jgi:uncharacterized protein (TIGR03067 family)
MRSFFVVALTATLLAIPAAAQNTGDDMHLQGVWIQEPAEGGILWTLVFAHGKLTADRWGGAIILKRTYQLKADKSLKRIDFKHDKGGNELLYDLKGDTLKLCTNNLVNGPPPTKFVADDKHTILIFKKAKPSD